MITPTKALIWAFTLLKFLLTKSGSFPCGPEWHGMPLPLGKCKEQLILSKAVVSIYVILLMKANPYYVQIKINHEYKSWSKQSLEKVRREYGSKMEALRLEGIRASENRINDKRNTRISRPYQHYYFKIKILVYHIT